MTIGFDATSFVPTVSSWDVVVVGAECSCSMQSKQWISTSELGTHPSAIGYVPTVWRWNQNMYPYTKLQLGGSISFHFYFLPCTAKNTLWIDSSAHCQFLPSRPVSNSC